MDCDVEAFVIHSGFFDAGAQVGFFRTHGRTHSVTGTARWIDDNVFGRRAAPGQARSQASSADWNVLLVRCGGRIFFRDDLVKLRFGVLASWTNPLYQISNGSSGRPSRT